MTDTSSQQAVVGARAPLTRRVLVWALAGALLLVGLPAALLLGGGSSSHSSGAHYATAAPRAAASAGSTHSAGASAPAASAGSTSAGAPSSAHSTTGAHAAEVRDPEEARSYPAPPGVQHATAAAPSKAGEAIVAPGAPSDAEVRAELQQMQAAEQSARELQRKRLVPVPGGQSIGGNGTLPIPTNVPEVVQRVIAGANEIADFPYVYGGGHASFVDNAYDCSGSVSYALAAGGLLGAPETSGELESWGVPGPGKYITVLANAGHTFMYVDGVLYDTAGRSGVYASRWLVGSTTSAGYVVRHWPGL